MAVPDYIDLPIPLPPRTQALNCTTFALPPLDGTLTLPEIYDFHLQHSPNHQLFVYADGSGLNHAILWSKAVRSIHRAGHIVQSRLNDGLVKPLGKPIVAILALSGMSHISIYE
jgi:hypothetical protein